MGVFVRLFHGCLRSFVRPFMKGQGNNGPDRSYDIIDTAGCSCEQIIENLELGTGHSKFGCSISAMDDWVEIVNP